MEVINHQTCYKVHPKNVSAEPAKTYKLSAEQIQYYKENGFLVIKRLFEFTDLYNFKQHFVRICKGLEETPYMTVVKEHKLIGNKDKDNKETYINKLQDIHYDEVFMTYTEHPIMLDIVAQFIGDDITLINSMFINKPPGTQEHAPHQDLHYFPYRPADKIIATWMAIDDATKDNGCLWVIPGSHLKNELYTHSNYEGALRLYHGISDGSVAPLDKRVSLEMCPGDTVFFHPLIVHGSWGNVSKNYRKCISCHYKSSHCETVDVRGTEQELVQRELEAEAERRGIKGLNFEELVEVRSKVVRTKSKL